MATKKRFERIVAWFSAGEDKEIRHQCEWIDRILDELGEKTEHVALCRYWRNEATHALNARPIDYDRAWGALLEIRHLFCRMLHPLDLDRVLLDVQADVAYLRSDRAKSETKLRGIAKELSSLEPKKEAAHLAQIKLVRLELEHFSHLTANARSSQWYKINLYRKRLRKMGTYMAAALVILTLVLMYPAVFKRDDDNVLILFAVVGFGCLGGFLSALLTPEPLSRGSSAFYMERGLLLLRPTIGAVAGLVMYYLQKAGLVTIGTNPGPFTYYVGAFGAGFSERYFVKKLAPFLGTRKGKEESDGGKDDDEQRAAWRSPRALGAAAKQAAALVRASGRRPGIFR
jgi:hypothetical protein